MQITDHKDVTFTSVRPRLIFCGHYFPFKYCPRIKNNNTRFFEICCLLADIFESFVDYFVEIENWEQDEEYAELFRLKFIQTFCGYTE